jgi:hypothetical protein
MSEPEQKDMSLLQRMGQVPTRTMTLYVAIAGLLVYAFVKAF